jgi:hypothetical protein
VPDGQEPQWNEDSDGDGLINALDPDSDNDGLFDGTELGLDCANPDTDATKATCVADADGGATVTDPLDADTDDGGVTDGGEDTNLDGAIDPGETDPTAGHGADDGSNIDSDGDGLTDGEEGTLGTDPHDADSDDDGVIDGQEPNPGVDSDGDGLINALDPDSDGDGLHDGTEMGKDCSNADTDGTKGNCVPDADGGATTTSPLDPDTDHGGIPDGVEDANHNGQIDPGEGDPNDPSDDMPPGGCTSDSDCGGTSSGQVCDPATHQCVNGCRGLNGNGCPAGKLCTSLDETIGMCVDHGAGGAGGEGGESGKVFAEGGGLFCAASPGTNGTDAGWLISAIAVGLVLARRRPRRR